MRETTKTCGTWHIRLIGPDGSVKEERQVKNLIVNDGLDWLRSYAFLGGSPTSQPDPMDYIAIGSDGTTVTATDSALGTELARQTFDTITEGGTGVITVDVTYAAGVGTGSVAEAGCFNDGSAGDMWNRVAFSAVNKTASDVLKVSMSMTFTSS